MPKGYTTLENVENYMLITVDASFESQVATTWLSTVEDIIDKFTGRNFIADDPGTQKIYEVKLEHAVDIARTFPSIRSLIIDEATEVEDLQIDDDDIASGDYLVYPPNDTPKLQIVLRDTSTAVFTLDQQNIKVTAKWGFSATVPSDIEFAATVLLAGIVQHSWSSEGEVESVTMGRVTLAYKNKKEISDFESVREILKTYRKVM